jgi:hypothetical protein
LLCCGERNCIRRECRHHHCRNCSCSHRDAVVGSGCCGCEKRR